MEVPNLFQQLFSATRFKEVIFHHLIKLEQEYRGEFVDQLTPTQKLNHQASLISKRLDFQQQCSKESVEKLLEHGYTMKKMSQQLLTNVGKVEYCMRKHGLHIRKFRNISNKHLDQLVTSLVELFLNAGFKILTDHYKALEVTVSRDKLRNSIAQVTFYQGLPLKCSIPRRCYSVAGPLSLWHIDSHHKLIRWKLIIHGGVDGYSILNVFFGLSYNNRSSTFLRQFKSGVSTWGLPVRVRQGSSIKMLSVNENTPT